MIVKNMELEAICGITSKLSGSIHPEFAFAGRSNVGKPSPINTLTNRKSYARISSQPGKTQIVNFYHTNDVLYCVDLSSYGYAEVILTMKEEQRKMIENYLRKSPTLGMAFPLINIRRESSANDEIMYDWIVRNGYHPTTVATKLDKINHGQIQKHVKMLRTGLRMKGEDVLIPLSVETKQGRGEIWELTEGQVAD